MVAPRRSKRLGSLNDIQADDSALPSDGKDKPSLPSDKKTSKTPSKKSTNDVGVKNDKKKAQSAKKTPAKAKTADEDDEDTKTPVRRSTRSSSFASQTSDSSRRSSRIAGLAAAAVSTRPTRSSSITSETSVSRRVTRSSSIVSSEAEVTPPKSKIKKPAKSTNLKSVKETEVLKFSSEKATRKSSRKTNKEEEEEELIDTKGDSDEYEEEDENVEATISGTEMKNTENSESTGTDSEEEKSGLGSEESEDEAQEEENVAGSEDDKSESDSESMVEKSDSEGIESGMSEPEDIISKLAKRVEEKKRIEQEDSDVEAESETEDEESLESEDSADEEERALEAQVFGSFGIENVHEKMKVDNKISKKRKTEDTLFFEDRGDLTEDEKNNTDEEANAWKDADDDEMMIDLDKVNRIKKLKTSIAETKITGTEYSRRLKEQHEKLHPVSWATRPDTEDENIDDDDEIDQLMRTSDSYLRAASAMRLLPAGRLLVGRLNDANQMSPSKSVVQSVDWHKGGQILTTAGFDKTVRLFKIDGKTNHKIQSIYLKDMPIYSARFTGPLHEELICVGRRKFFYWIDLETGSIGKIPCLHGRKEKSLESMYASPEGSFLAFAGYDGSLLLTSQKTKQLVTTLKMNGNVSCATFSPDGLTLYSSGDRGDVFVWDLRMNRCRSRFHDEGSTGTRSICTTRDKIAVGSNNGVVNLYDIELATQSRTPEPLKAIMNLTTPVDDLTFNYDGQLLAMLSRRTKDCLRLFNVNALEAVPNWPTAGTPLHYASCVRFSPDSSKISIGNDRGRCLLYRINHY